MKSASSRPSTTLAGCGPPASRRGTKSKGSGVADAANTTFPNRLPFSTCVSASAATWGRTSWIVAACPRANRRPWPSATLTVMIPPGARKAAASA